MKMLARAAMLLSVLFQLVVASWVPAAPASAVTVTGLKNVLIWDPRFPNREPWRIVVTSPVAQAIVADGAGTIASAIPDPISALGTLSLSPLTATAGIAYAGTISGTTAGSMIAATSSDGTALTVAGGTLGGTFSAAGPPTITLTETLAGAVGSPRVTTVPFTVVAGGNFTLPDSFNYAVVGDSIDIGPLKDGLREALGQHGYLIAAGDQAVSSQEVIQNTVPTAPYTPNQYALIHALPTKPAVLMIGGGENSLAKGDTDTHILSGYQQLVAAAKADGMKVIIRMVSTSWMTGQNSTKLTYTANLKSAVLALAAADPANVMAIDTDAYDHTVVGNGYNTATGNPSFPDGSQHPNTARGAYLYGQIMAAAILPKISGTDSSLFPASGNLVQGQNLNPLWNWGTFSTASGTGWSGQLPAGVTFANTSDAPVALAQGTVTSGDTALVVSDTGTQTATTNPTDGSAPPAWSATIPFTAALKAGRAYVVDAEVEVSGANGSGDAVGLYNLSAQLNVNGSTVGSAYTGGSTYAPANELGRKTWIRTYMTAAGLAADATGGTIVITGQGDARAHGYQVKIGRVFVRAPNNDPVNRIVNLAAIGSATAGSPVTLSVARGHTVGSKTFNWSASDGQSGTITIAQGATTGTATWTPAAAGSATVTISDPAVSVYKLGTASQNVTVQAAGGGSGGGSTAYNLDVNATQLADGATPTDATGKVLTIGSGVTVAGGRLVFNGTAGNANSDITTPYVANTWNLGTPDAGTTGDYTIILNGVTIPTLGSTMVLASDYGDSTHRGWYLGLSTTGALQFVYGSADGTAAGATWSAGYTFTAGTEVSEIRLVKTNATSGSASTSTITAYVNGSAVGTRVMAQGTADLSSVPLAIGALGTNGSSATGGVKIGRVRIIRGSAVTTGANDNTHLPGAIVGDQQKAA